MSEPRYFYLSGKRGQASLEFTPKWREAWGIIVTTETLDRAIEIAPGVRVALRSHGEYVLPGDQAGIGAVIAVWDERAGMVPAEGLVRGGMVISAAGREVLAKLLRGGDDLVCAGCRHERWAHLGGAGACGGPGLPCDLGCPAYISRKGSGGE